MVFFQALIALVSFLAMPMTANAANFNFNVRGVDHIEKAAIQKLLKSVSNQNFELETISLFEENVLGMKVVGTFEKGKIQITEPGTCPECSRIKIQADNRIHVRIQEPKARLSGWVKIAWKRESGDVNLLNKAIQIQGVQALSDSQFEVIDNLIHLKSFEISGAKIGSVTVQDRGAWLDLFDRLLRVLPVCGQGCDSLDEFLAFVGNGALQKLKDSRQLRDAVVRAANEELMKLANTILNLEKFGVTATVKIQSVNTDANTLQAAFDVSASPYGEPKNCRVENVYSDQEELTKGNSSAVSSASADGNSGGPETESANTDFSAVVGIPLVKNVFSTLATQGQICIEDEAIWQRWGLRFSVRPRSNVKIEADSQNPNVWSVLMPAAGRIFKHENSRIALSSGLGKGNIRLRYEVLVEDQTKLKLKFKSVALGKLTGRAYVGKMAVPLEWFRSPILAGIYIALNNHSNEIVLLRGDEEFFDMLKIQAIENPRIIGDSISIGFSVYAPAAVAAKQ